MEEQNAALVRRAVEEIWNQGDLDVAELLFAADYVNHAGLIPDLVRGPEAIRISVALYRLAFPDFWITVDELTTDQDTVQFSWTARNTPAAGSSSSSVHNPLRGTMRIRCVAGQLAESWIQWDQQGVLEQLGFIRRGAPPDDVLP